MDQFSVLRVAGKKLLRLRQFKVSKVKTGCHRAAHQGKVAFGQLCAKPAARRHHGLELLARSQIGAEFPLLVRAIWKDAVHAQCGASIKVPHLVRLDAVQRRDVACLQQKVDGGGSRPVSVKPRGQGLCGKLVAGAVGFLEPASFGMAGQCQLFDERLCGGAVLGRRLMPMSAGCEGRCNDSRVLRRNTLIRLWGGSGCWIDQTPGGLQPALVLEAAMGNQSVTSIRQKSLFCLLAPVNKAQDAMKSGVLSAKKAAFVRRRLAGLLPQGQRCRSVSPALRQRSSRVRPAP